MISAIETTGTIRWKNRLAPANIAGYPYSGPRNVRTTVPVHLQDAHYHGHEQLGHGIGYKYAHDYPGHYVKQQYLPDEIRDAVFYEPTENGYEKTIAQYLNRIRSDP